MTTASDISSIFQTLGVPLASASMSASTSASTPALPVHSPIDGGMLAQVACSTLAQTQTAIDNAHSRFLSWRNVPAPKRGELVRVFGEMVRQHKEPLGRLISLETGKILQEGLGEVQEVVDICEFAVGLSRQLYGLTIASERPDHKLLETWHPVGVVGVISAFNFPMAVFSWNAAIRWSGNRLRRRPCRRWRWVACC